MKLQPTKDTVRGPGLLAPCSLTGGGAGGSPLHEPFYGKQPHLQIPVSPFVLSMAGIQKHVFLEPLVTLPFFFFLIKQKRYLTCKVKK